MVFSWYRVLRSESMGSAGEEKYSFSLGRSGEPTTCSMMSFIIGIADFSSEERIPWDIGRRVSWLKMFAKFNASSPRTYTSSSLRMWSTSERESICSAMSLYSISTNELRCWTNTVSLPSCCAEMMFIVPTSSPFAMGSSLIILLYRT